MPHIRGRSPLCSTWDIDEALFLPQTQFPMEYQSCSKSEILEVRSDGHYPAQSCSLIKAARTKREGGVTSPGIPKNPLPAPKERRATFPND